MGDLVIAYMSYLEVIWNPEKSRAVDPSHPALNCPIRFLAVPPVADGKSGKGRQFQEIEIKSVLLTHGSNRVDAELWGMVREQEQVQRFVDAGALTVIEPRKDIEEHTGTTLDFGVVEAIAIANESLDIDWLKKCIMVESANPEKRGKASETERVVKACELRVKSIQSSERKMAAANLNKGLEEVGA